MKLHSNHWVYLLCHILVMLVGLFAVVLSKDIVVQAVATSLIAGGIAGWALFLHVWLTQDTTERLQMLAQFGFVSAFSARSIQIKAEYDKRLALAREHIDVMGFGLNSLRQDYGKDFSTWVARAKVRILLLDPEFPRLDSTVADLRDLEEGEAKGTIQRNVHDMVRALAPIIATSNGRCQIRLYRCLPSVNIFRIDDEAFWGPYFVKLPSRNTPTFVVRRGGIIYQSLIQHFETIWSDGTLSRAVPPEWLVQK